MSYALLTLKTSMTMASAGKVIAQILGHLSCSTSSHQELQLVLLCYQGSIDVGSLPYDLAPCTSTALWFSRWAITGRKTRLGFRTGNAPSSIPHCSRWAGKTWICLKSLFTGLTFPTLAVERHIDQERTCLSRESDPVPCPEIAKGQQCDCKTVKQWTVQSALGFCFVTSLQSL